MLESAATEEHRFHVTSTPRRTNAAQDRSSRCMPTISSGPSIMDSQSLRRIRCRKEDGKRQYTSWVERGKSDARGGGCTRWRGIDSWGTGDEILIRSQCRRSFHVVSAFPFGITDADKDGDIIFSSVVEE